MLQPVSTLGNSIYFMETQLSKPSFENLRDAVPFLQSRTILYLPEYAKASSLGRIRGHDSLVGKHIAT